MADPVRIAAIKSELEIDALGLGYAAPNAGVEADAIADLALMSVVNRVVDKETLSGSELFEAIDIDEWRDRSSGAKDNIRLVIGLGDSIQIATGTKARLMMQDALQESPTAVNSLAELASIGSKIISRAEELDFGRVTIGDIQAARVS